MNDQFGQSKPLLEKKEKWYREYFKRPYTNILFLILFLIGIFFLYNVVISIGVQSKSDGSQSMNTSSNSLHISSVATTNGDYLKQCAPSVTCDPNAKYRSINGSCNNLQTPTWGASLTPLLRLIDANYSDGYYNLREQANGKPLPNLRVLNIDLFLGKEQYRVDENNVLLIPYGQLLAHDVSVISPDLIKDSEGTPIKCCEKNTTIVDRPQCVGSYEIPVDDPVYGNHHIRCQGRFRYQTSRNYSCPLYPTTFINTNTHFMDGSDIYGSTESIARSIRMMEGGRLNFSTNENGQMFCPYTETIINLPSDLKHIKFQYNAGEPDNVNQNIGITAMTTLYLRFHNFIAFKLASLNPFWNDETLYQETRRFVVGTLQRTAYEDFLPIVIGKDYQELYGLNKENIYDPTVNPSTSLEFSTAGFRVLHSLIPVQFNFMNNNYTIDSSMIITKWMSDPKLLPIGYNFDKLFKGFLETAGRVAQPSFNFFISNFMFQSPSEPPYKGFDLMAGDILAGRDHGLQPYNRVRHLCGLPLAKDFEDLTDLIHIKDINLLKKHYDTVDDIDLIVGLLLEKLSDGALVGPTARCLIADNFYRFKAGDRFFYDVRGQPGSFTPDQLKTIKKITLGHVICASTNVDHVQVDIFKKVDHNLFPTSKLKCDNEFYIDLNAWKQTWNTTEL